MRVLRFASALSAVILSSAVLPDIAMTETAASISYETTARPSELSDDFATKNGVDLRFLALKAIDGNEIKGALWQPAGKAPADTTIVIMIHGSGGSYRRAPESALGARLAVKGYAALAIDTRQLDERINTENFFDVRRDIEAALYTARALGYRSIVLQGHSLGNIQVQFFAANNWDKDIKGVMLLGSFSNLPWKTRNILVQNEPEFQKLIAAALQAYRDGKMDTPLDVKMQYFTGQQVPVTAQHFLTCRWSKSSVADGTMWIKQVPYPVLLVRDQADGLVQSFEPASLLDAAHSEGSLPAVSERVSRLPPIRSRIVLFGAISRAGFAGRSVQNSRSRPSQVLPAGRSVAWFPRKAPQLAGFLVPSRSL